MKPTMATLVAAYATALGAGLAWLALGGAAVPGQQREIDVERINIREPDGTLRMTIASHARMPGLIVAGKEIPHPNRPEAGMILFNDEGTENGGLVFDGAMRGGRPTNSGSFTFDRWRQDQTIQLFSQEDGDSREAAVRIVDRPDRPADFTRAQHLRAMPPGPARDAAFSQAGFDAAQRAYLGRTPDKAAQLALRDAAGRERLVLRVEADGAARIRFLDAAGRPTRTIDAAP